MMTPDELKTPATEIEVAELLNAEGMLPAGKDIIRRMGFELFQLRSTAAERKLDRFKNLYIAINEMMAILGADGEISTDQVIVEDVMFSLKQIDGGTFDIEKVFGS